MNEFIKQHSLIALQLISIAVAITVGSFVSYIQEREVTVALTTQIATTEQKLAELAVITDRNGADEAIASIIIDCPRREEYESLLIKLGTLSKKDLVSVQNLFESCGSFFAERKALMVAKLERELDSYMSLIELLHVLDAKKAAQFDSLTWSEIVTLEKERSALLTDQSIIQEKIIRLLISGSTLQGNSEVEQLVQEAQEISQLLGVTDHEIDERRTLVRE